jgi:hypothetical protein
VDTAGGFSRAVRLRLRDKATKERAALAYEQLVPVRRQRLGGGRLSREFEQRGCHRQSLIGVRA